MRQCVQGQLLASMVGPPKVTLHQATCWPYTAQFLLSKELFLSLSQGLTTSLFSHLMQWERVSAINARGRTGPRSELRGVADIISTAPRTQLSPPPSCVEAMKLLQAPEL